MSSYREHSNEWRCLICESWNESWRKVCRVCGTDKSKQGSEPPGKDVWQCPFCGTWNEYSEKFCWFCGLIPEEPKPEPTIKEGWKCPHCGTWNESTGSSEKVCRYCKQILTGGSKPDREYPSFLWVVIAVAILVISLLIIPGILQDIEDRKEEKARNPVMASVGACIREASEVLKNKEVNTILEWNPGNHFKDVDIRTARAFAWARSVI